jgi:hypothetical protein
MTEYPGFPVFIQRMLQSFSRQTGLKENQLKLRHPFGEDGT